MKKKSQDDSCLVFKDVDGKEIRVHDKNAIVFFQAICAAFRILYAGESDERA